MGDFVSNENSHAEINFGNGDNTVFSSGDFATINTGFGNDSIIIGGIQGVVSASGGNNFLDCSGENMTVNSGDGNDSVLVGGIAMLIMPGGGDDTVENYGKNNSIIADSGNFTIKNEGTNLTLQSSNESDFVGILNGTVTVKAVAAETFDSLSSTIGASNSLVINLGSGNDTVQNADSDVTIKAGDGDKILENYGANVVFMIGNGQQTLKNEGSDATIQADENFDSDEDNVIVNEGENAVIDCNKIKGAVLNGFDITDEKNQISENDFNSVIEQMESEVQNFYQNIFNDDATLRSIFEDDVNIPYLHFIN